LHRDKKGRLGADTRVTFVRPGARMAISALCPAPGLSTAKTAWLSPMIIGRDSGLAHEHHETAKPQTLPDAKTPYLSLAFRRKKII